MKVENPKNETVLDFGLNINRGRDRDRDRERDRDRDGIFDPGTDQQEPDLNPTAESIFNF